MELAIKGKVFTPLPGPGQLPHLAAQPAHFLDIVTVEPTALYFRDFCVRVSGL
jgi:hypothetical protein